MMNFLIFKCFSQNAKNFNRQLREIRLTPTDLPNPTRFDKFVLRKFRISWTLIQKLFREQRLYAVKSDGTKLTDPTSKIEISDRIFLPNDILQAKENNEVEKAKQLSNEERLEYISIFNKMKVLETDNFVVLDKYCNLAVQAGTNLRFSLDLIMRAMNQISAASKLSSNKSLDYLDEYKLCHRLDKPVSGLVVVAKNITFARQFSDQKERRASKIYLSLNSGVPKYVRELIKEEVIGNKNAKKFAQSFSGLINSNENADQFLIKIDNGMSFTHADTIKAIKSQNDNNELNEMIGKFSITHLLFYYDKQFQVFNLLESEEYTKDKRTQLINLLKNDLIEVYTINLYELITGKKHQIRKHMAKCFFTPIFNDERYLFSAGGSRLFSLFTDMFRPKLEDINANSDQNLFERLRINHPFYSIYLHSLQLKMDRFSDKEKILFLNDSYTLHNNKEAYIIRTKLPKNFETLLKEIGADDVLTFYNNNTYLNLV